MEKEIRREDIRVGDTIRREWIIRKVKWMTEAKVVEVSEGGLELKVEGRTTWLHAKDHTYILVDRPKPPLPTEPDSLIKVTKLDDENGEWLAKLSENGSWNVFDLVGDDGMYWVRPFRIQEWNLIEILEVNK